MFNCLGLNLKISSEYLLMYVNMKPISYLPNKQTMVFINCCLYMAQVANCKSQSTTYNKLFKKSPKDSTVVVLIPPDIVRRYVC